MEQTEESQVLDQVSRSDGCNSRYQGLITALESRLDDVVRPGQPDLTNEDSGEPKQELCPLAHRIRLQNEALEEQNGRLQELLDSIKL